MCYTLNESLTGKTFTGYKLVSCDEHGHTYSAFTGVRYEAGKNVPVPTKPGKYMTWLAKSPASKSNMNYRKELIGRTAVFTNYQTAKDYAYDMLNRFSHISIAEITISGDLRCGYFYEDEVVSGTKIESIKFIKKIS